MLQYLSSAPARIKKYIGKKPLGAFIMIFLLILILMLAANEIRFMIPNGHGILVQHS